MFFTFLLLLLFGGTALAYTGGGCAEGVPVGELKVVGLSMTKEKVVTRELALRSGVPYSDSLYEADARRLERLDIFASIELTCEQAGSVQNLTLHLSEIFPVIPSSAGKRTDQDGLLLGVALAFLNAGGEDIRAEAQYRASVSPAFENSEFAIYLSSPWLLDLPIEWNIDLVRTDSHDDLRGFHSKSWLADLDLRWRFLDPFQFLFTTAYRYQESYGNIPELGAGFAIDTRDSPTDTRRGFYEEFMLTQVGGAMDSPENYREILFDTRAAVSPYRRWVLGGSLLLRYRLGDVDFFDRFHHGGSNSFRGYEADSSNHGESEVLMNFEERIIILERVPITVVGVRFYYGLQLVAGLDGSVLFDGNEILDENFSGAAYVGVHILLPAIDRVRFEVGYAPDTGEPKFFIGLNEKNISQRWRTR